MRTVVDAVFFVVIALAVTGCQSPHVIYQNTAPTPQSADAGSKYEEDVSTAAVNGAQVFSLPFSAISITKVIEEDITQNASLTPPAPDNRPGGGRRSPSNNPRNVASTQSLPGAVPLGGGYNALIVPIESDASYRVAGIANFWSNTTLSMKRMPNTDVPTSVNVVFSDLVPSRIQSLVSLAVAAAGVVTPTSSPATKVQGPCASEREPSTFAFVVNEHNWNLLLGDGMSIPEATGKPSCWLIHIEDVRPEYDVVTRAWFAQQITNAKNELKAQYFPVAACATADLRIDEVTEGRPYDKFAKPKYSGRLTVVDPRMLRLLGLPERGDIAMHPTCGADLTAVASDRYEPYFDAAISALNGLKPSKKAQSNARDSK